MAKSISTQVGIYDTQYTLINHRDGSISVKTPYVKWTGNSGVLAFKNIKITKFVDAVKDCFSDYDNSEFSISELINDQPEYRNI